MPARPRWWFSVRGFDITHVRELRVAWSAGFAPRVLTERDKNFYESKCAPLDRQIDNLVYVIYDLTPEEIAIVEGQGKWAAGLIANFELGTRSQWQAGLCCQQARNFPTPLFWRLPQIVLGLHACPQFGTGSESIGEAQGHLGRDPRASIQDARKRAARDSQMLGGSGHRHAAQIIPQHSTRMGWIEHPHRNTSVIILIVY